MHRPDGWTGCPGDLEQVPGPRCAVPIIVLTHASYPKSKDETQEQRDQRTLLSTHGVNMIVPRTGHYVQYDRPEIVIDAVNQAVAIAKEQRAN